MLDVGVAEPKLQPSGIMAGSAKRCPHVWRNTCGCMCRSPARSPAPSIILATLERVMGPPRSLVNTNLIVAPDRAGADVRP